MLVRAQGIGKSARKGVWSEDQLKTKRKEKQGVWMDGVQASLTSACLCSISEPLGTMSSGTSDSCVWADVILIKLCLPGLDPAGIRDYFEDSSVLHRLWSHCCLYPAQIFPRYIFSSPHHWQLPYLFLYPSKMKWEADLGKGRVKYPALGTPVNTACVCVRLGLLLEGQATAGEHFM